MLDSTLNYFMREPRWLENLGSTLASIGTTVILAGLLGHVGVVATGAIGSLAGQNTVKTLAEIYPSLPTWWIPEGVVGGLPALILTASGIWLNVTGKRIRRFLEQ
ncbi:MAG: hypothetical protein HY799_03345 [Nitrosomonadales bacterium]|nr:hypothetical protein [Nitrosomonadales bacterium]